MKLYEGFVINFILTTGILAVLMIGFNSVQYVHLYSLISTVLAFLLCFIIFGRQTEEKRPIHSNFFNAVSEKSYWAFAITITNTLLGIVSLFLMSGKIDFSVASNSVGTNIEKLFLTSNGISVVIVQFGGWFLQSILLYFTAILFDQEIKFKKLLNITGVSYIGFLLSTLVLMVYNYFYYDSPVLLEDFTKQSFSSIMSPTFAKTGEYITLGLIAFFVYQITDKRITKLKAILIATIPGFVLLLVEQIFKYVF